MHGGACLEAVCLLGARGDTTRWRVAQDVRARKTDMTFRSGLRPWLRAHGVWVTFEEHLLERLPVDPWGHDYVYRVEAGAPVILSYGRDGIPDGEGPDADLSSRVLLAE